MRRTELHRRTPLKRGGRISHTSKKRLEELKDRPAIRKAVFECDGGCLAAGIWGPCYGPLTPHHLLKASQGGKFEMSNLISLCSHHNTMVEDHPLEANNLGFVIKRSSLPQEPDAGCGGPPPPSCPAVSDARHGALDLLGEFIADTREDITSGCVWPEGEAEE